MREGSVIASGHPLTTEAAAHAIQSGGNAFDAVLSGWLVSCLAEPVLTSPAGGGFAMVSPASGRTRLYDFFTQTPKSPNPNGRTYPLEANFGSTRQVFHLGPGTVATPGCVAGILRMHADFGMLPVRECTAPARELCQKGLEITSHAATLLRVVSELYKATPESRNLFSSHIHKEDLLHEGEFFHNPQFGNFLDMLETEGVRWFYEGDVGRLVSELCQNQGGHLTREDFEHYQVMIREPLELHHGNSTIWLNPPPSMGGTLIALGLQSANKSVSGTYPFHQGRSWENWISPIRLMSLLRSPLSSSHLQQSDLEPLKIAIEQNQELQAALASLFPHAWNQVHSSGTTQLSIIDKQGNEISMTTSNGAGSAVILKDTGFMLNNMLGEEDLQPEGMHTWKPDTRLSSMMAPTLVRLSNGCRVATGSGGSNRIRSTVLQILRHLVEHGVSLEAAIKAPRLHWEDGELHAESGAFSSINQHFPQLTWPMIEHSVPNLFFGGAHSVARFPGGDLQGTGDPRRGGSACQIF